MQEYEFSNNFPNICRICIKTKSRTTSALSSFHSIYNSNNLNNENLSDDNNYSTNSNMKICEMITIISSINIDSNEYMMPDEICSKCYQNLLKAYKFRNICIESDKKIRNFLNSISVNMKNEIIKKRELNKTKIEQNDNTYNEQDQMNIELDEEQVITDTCTAYHREINNYCKNDDINEEDKISCDRYTNPVTENVEENYINADNVHHSTTENIISIHNEFVKCKKDIDTKDKSNKCSISEETDKIIELHQSIQDDTIESLSINLLLEENNSKLGNLSTSYTYKICEKSFESMKSLRKHKKSHENKSYICHVCNKDFRQCSRLKDHLRIHSGEQPFLCSECGKAFNNASNLRQHRIRHTGIKPFQCTECPSKFASKSGLQSHMTTHSKIKSYICDLCGVSFTKLYSLKKHKRIHTGERPFVCDVCGMRFNTSDNVKRHMRTHTGEKPYSCEHCKRAFSQSNDLVKHMRTHCNGKTYKCNECSMAFRLHSELKEHLREHFLQKK